MDGERAILLDDVRKGRFLEVRDYRRRNSENPAYLGDREFTALEELGVLGGHTERLPFDAVLEDRRFTRLAGAAVNHLPTIGEPLLTLRGEDAGGLEDAGGPGAVAIDARGKGLPRESGSERLASSVEPR